MSTTTILAVLITITVYSFITFIQALLFDIQEGNNTHGTLRFILAIVISLLLGVIYLIH